jgi:hypothetical protein
MRAWHRNAVVTAITIFVPLLSEHALAQNLLLNPNFDSTLDSWQGSSASQVAWTNAFNHDGEKTGPGGSIHLTTSATAPESFAGQCLPIKANETYSASAWVYSTCVGMRFYVFWATQDDCKDAGDFDSVNVRATESDTWEQVSLSAKPATTPIKVATKAVVTLINPGGCTTGGAYFDDVFFGPDAIFNDGFDGESLL